MTARMENHPYDVSSPPLHNRLCLILIPHNSPYFLSCTFAKKCVPGKEISPDDTQTNM